VNTTPIVLKALLQQRHLQTHSAFRREYDRVAEKLDKALKAGWPSKAQFYRWLSGDLVGLPHVDHCRVLEGMFPGWAVAQMFEVHDGPINFVPEPPGPTQPRTAPRPIPTTVPVRANVADLSAVFTSRSEFIQELPPRKLFDGAQRIRMVGLSLNLLCQHYPDTLLLKMLESGGTVECLFLDPNGESIARREREESHPVGVLSTLTDLNIKALQRIQAKLSSDARDNLVIRIYDETVRFNITIIDDETCVVQPYLPDARGVESPTLIMEKQPDGGGLYETFAQVFMSMWDRAKADE
jgi:hypothetical protein